MALRTIFFDFGGTLAEQITDPVDIWVSLAKRYEWGEDRAQIAKAVADANAWFQTAVYDYMGRMEEFWGTYDRHVLHSLGLGDPDDGLVAAIQDEFQGVAWNRAYPESLGVVEELRRHGYRLAVISNATEDIVDRLREIGLSEFFDAVTFSQEARANKPDPRIFRLALSRAGSTSQETAHVGNTYEDDVVGARGLGITPILVDREGRHVDADCLRVRDLRGVLPLLDAARP